MSTTNSSASLVMALLLACPARPQRIMGAFTGSTAPTTWLISSTSGATATNFGNSAANTAIAQSFTATSTGTLTKVTIPNLYKSGAPTDNVLISIYSNAAGPKPNVSIADATPLDGSTLTTSPVSHDFAFSLAVTSGTKYWIVMARSTAVNASNFYVVYVATTNAYTSGGQAKNGGSSWGTEVASNDYNFTASGTIP